MAATFSSFSSSLEEDPLDDSMSVSQSPTMHAFPFFLFVQPLVLPILPLCKENGPRAISLNEFWCLMINTIRELMNFLVFVFVVHRMLELLGPRN
jgi:hypothetical protein